jgi:hypothetical protein
LDLEFALEAVRKGLGNFHGDKSTYSAVVAVRE